MTRTCTAMMMDMMMCMPMGMCKRFRARNGSSRVISV